MVIVTIPEKNLPQLPADVFAGVPDSVIVVDTGNYYPQQRDGRIEGIEAGVTESRWVAQQLHRPVVKAFNICTCSDSVEGLRYWGIAFDGVHIVSGPLCILTVGSVETCTMLRHSIPHEFDFWTARKSSDIRDMRSGLLFAIAVLETSIPANHLFWIAEHIRRKWPSTESFCSGTAPLDWTIPCTTIASLELQHRLK